MLPPARHRVGKVTLACLLAVTGCDRQPVTTPAPPATGHDVSAAEAANATYTTENTASGMLQLVDGHYRDNDLVLAELDPLQASGDLDGDGAAERAVVLSTSTGGSGIFRDLYVLRRAGGKLQVSAPALLGDRIVLNDLRVVNGEVVVDLLVQGAADPLCCPTQAVSYRFRLAAGRLAEISGQQRIYLHE